jgi:hypothetical protein
MVIIVVARLRLRDPSLPDEFLTHAVAEPHLSTRGLADHLCDEASFVEWEQDGAKLPDWQTSWRHLVADGRSALLTNPSDANETRAFPAPVEPPPSVS